MQKYLYYFSLMILTFTCVNSCKDIKTETTKHYKISGQTMGTSYHISYKGNKIYKPAVDSLLISINNQVSTYIDTSVISKFNKSNKLFDLSLLTNEFPDTAQHFIQNYIISEEIYELTNGQFDPTVMPLVNYWGFGYQKRSENIDTTMIDSLVQLVGMNLIETNDYLQFNKTNPKCQLDFSAVAKGYAVDEIADYLSQQNILNYMVEIGGELKVEGLNSSDRPWVIGINQPSEKSTTNDLSLLIGITDCAVATSGNYRNYYIAQDQKFVHTINPVTGYTEQNNLLSATIIGRSCARVDAIATACMVMGVNKSKVLVSNDHNLEACFIYSLPSGKDSVWVTDGFNEMIISN